MLDTMLDARQDLYDSKLYCFCPRVWLQSKRKIFRGALTFTYAHISTNPYCHKEDEEHTQDLSYMIFEADSKVVKSNISNQKTV